MGEDRLSAILSGLADATAVMTFLGIALVAVFGSRLRRIVISSMKARALQRVDGFGGRGTAARHKLRQACRRQITTVGNAAEDWSVSGEILWLTRAAQSGAADDQFTWKQPELAVGVARELRAYARRLELSTWVRIGSSTLADEQIERATKVATVLEEDADFRSAASGLRPEAGRAEPSVDLRRFGIDVLAGPRWATDRAERSTSQRPFFDQLRVSLQDTDFGAFGPLDDLRHSWRRVDRRTRDVLERRATDRADVLIQSHPDSYNGVFPRLLDWRVEASSTGPVRRLHLHVERTTFLTWWATNGDQHLPDSLRPLLAPAAPGPAVGANHVPVTVAVTSEDGYVVLPQRAPDLAIYPNTFVSAANGNIEIEPRHGMPADLDGDGFVDFLGAALRECREELGARIDIEREDLRVAALIRYSDTSEVEAPVLVLHANSGLSLEQIVDGMKYAHPIEGAFEIGDVVLGVPVSPEHCDVVIPWLAAECLEKRLTVPGFTSTLIAIASVAGPTAVARSLAGVPASSERPSCVQIIHRRPVR